MSDTEALARRLEEAGAPRQDVKDALFALRYGRKPFEMSEGAWLRRIFHSETETLPPYNPRDVELTVALMTEEVNDMSDTITIKFEDVGGNRVRASIENINGGDLGVMAVAGDRQTAAGQVVKLHDAIAADASPQWQVTGQPEGVKITNNYNVPPDGRPVHYGRHMIERVMRDVAQAGRRVRILYEDSHGHQTTRTIAPSEVKANGNVIAWDDLRDAIRSFRLAGIQSIQEV